MERINAGADEKMKHLCKKTTNFAGCETGRVVRF